MHHNSFTTLHVSMMNHYWSCSRVTEMLTLRYSDWWTDIISCCINNEPHTSHTVTSRLHKVPPTDHVWFPHPGAAEFWILIGQTVSLSFLFQRRINFTTEKKKRGWWGNYRFIGFPKLVLGTFHNVTINEGKILKSTLRHHLKKKKKTPLFIFFFINHWQVPVLLEK